MLEIILLLTEKLVQSYLFLKLISILIISLVVVSFIAVLYTILVYCVLIRFNFIRELLKDCGLPIPIQYKDTDS